jgi:hypothetical protein
MPSITRKQMGERQQIPVFVALPAASPTADLARNRYDQLRAAPAPQTAATWYTTALLLNAAAAIVGHGSERGKQLLDRARDCVHRSLRASR